MLRERSGGEALELALLGEPAQRAARELADALGREAHPLRHLAQRERLGAADPEAELDDLARVRVKPLERLADRSPLDLAAPLPERRRALRRQHRAELWLAVRADRRLEADRHALGRAQLLDLRRVHVERLRELLDRGVAAQFGRELALGGADLRQLLADVDRDPDGAAV